MHHDSVGNNLKNLKERKSVAGVNRTNLDRNQQTFEHITLNVPNEENSEELALNHGISETG